MSTVDDMEVIIRRAFLRDELLQKENLTRPLLTPDSQEAKTVAIAVNQLRSALHANEIAMKVLKWYANPENYEKLEFPTNVGQDGGLMARHALSVLEGA